MSEQQTTLAPRETKPAEQPKPTPLIVRDDGPIGYLLDTARFSHMKTVAAAMARASLLPDHLKSINGKALPFEQIVGNCLLVVNQAIRWGMDPFAVAPETYVVHGKLGFQGKLIAALMNTRGGLAGRLAYSFTGKGDDRMITVTGTFATESLPRMITLTVGQAKTFDKDGKVSRAWTQDPDQKLVYSGATKWARRHAPEVMLGVLSDDELHDLTLDVTSEPAGALDPPYNPPTPEEIAEAEAMEGESDAAPEPRPEAEDKPASPQPPAWAVAESEYNLEIPTAAMIGDVDDIERRSQVDDRLKGHPDAQRRITLKCGDRRLTIRSQRGGKRGGDA